MSKIPIDPVKLIEQTAPQFFGSVDPYYPDQTQPHHLSSHTRNDMMASVGQ